MQQPLYRQIAGSLEARISTGRYRPEELLPSEGELEREFGVSRITVRKALDQLKQKGLLYARSGKGTIVRTDALVSQAMKFTGSIAELSYYAQSTRYTPKSCTYIRADQRLSDRLRVRVGEEVLLVSGTRGNRKGPPFAFEQIYVPRQFSEGIDNFELGGRTIFGMIEKVHGVSIGEVRQVVTAVMPDRELREVLNITPRQCCLRAVRLYLARDLRPVQLAIVHYDSTKFEHTTVVYAD